jgi:hypothetical protein
MLSPSKYEGRKIEKRKRRKKLILKKYSGFRRMNNIE